MLIDTCCCLFWLFGGFLAYNSTNLSSKSLSAANLFLSISFNIIEADSKSLHYKLILISSFYTYLLILIPSFLSLLYISIAIFNCFIWVHPLSVANALLFLSSCSLDLIYFIFFPFFITILFSLLLSSSMFFPAI